MAGEIIYLPDASRDQEREKIDGASHPYRKLTEEIQQKPEKAWDRQTAREVAAVFDELSVDWNERFFPGEFDGLKDALKRGNVPEGVSCIELGAGTGMGTKVLGQHCAEVIAVDISLEMLKLFSESAESDKSSFIRVRADASILPFQDNSADLVALINMFLFADEIERILKPNGKVLWYSSLGDDTPIYLPPQEVLNSFSGDWSATASKIGRAEWCVFERS